MKTLKALFLIAALALVLAPSLFAQVESYWDTLKVNTTAQFIVEVGQLDSLNINIMFADSASGRVRVKPYNAPNGRAALTGVAADTMLLLEFGPLAVAAKLGIPWHTFTIAGNWNGIMPDRVLIEVIFYDDASTYGGFANQSVKYFQMDVRKFKHTELDYGLERYTGILKRSTTVSQIIRVDDCDSLQILYSYPDSAMGRIRVSAMTDIKGVATAITGDTVMARLLTGKNIGGGQDRLSFQRVRALGAEQTGHAFPTVIQVDLILDATVTAHGGARPIKRAELAIRKFRHK
jgi:hypothetical protein